MCNEISSIFIRTRQGGTARFGAIARALAALHGDFVFNVTASTSLLGVQDWLALIWRWSDHQIGSLLSTI